MAGNRLLTLINGVKTWVAALQVSSGASSAGQIVALNSVGQIDATMIPSSTGQSALSVPFSAAVSAGQLVSLYNNAGTLTARPADNTNSASSADGYVTAAVASGATGTVTLTGGMISGLSGLTPGAIYYLGTAGSLTLVPPSASGSIIQAVGKALSATSIEFVPDYPALIQ